MLHKLLTEKNSNKNVKYLFSSLNILDMLGKKRVKLKPKSTAPTHKSRSSFIIQAMLKMYAIKYHTLPTSFWV